MDLASEEQREGIEIYAAGFPVLVTVLPELLIADQRTFVPMIMLLIILTLYAAFRSFWGILLPLLTVIISVIWVLGFLVLCGKAVEIVTSVLPPLILVIAIADAVHVLAHYQEELERNRNRQEAVRDATAYILVPCFLTSVTTSIGFGSLMVSQIRGIRDLGLLASFGVMGAFVVSITLLPVLLSVLPVESFQRPARRRLPIVDRGLAGLARFNESHKVLVLVSTLALIGFSVAGIFRLKVETTLLKYLKDDNPLVRAVMHIEEYLTGTSTLDLVFTFDGPDEAKSPENLAKVLALEGFLKEKPQVTHVFSLVDILRRMQQGFQGGDPAFYRIPDTQEENAQYLLLYSMSGDEGAGTRRISIDTWTINTRGQF
jgi:predicted RND superfamily exporter protein